MSQQKIRESRVKNMYNIKPKNIEKMIVLDKDRLHKEPFWRNDVISAWCLSGGVGKGYCGDWIDSYWIGFYDEDAKSYAGKIRLQCNAYEDMCSYNFKNFFDYKEIQSEIDLELQEELLAKINWMLDEGILGFKKE